MILEINLIKLLRKVLQFYYRSTQIQIPHFCTQIKKMPLFILSFPLINKIDIQPLHDLILLLKGLHRNFPTIEFCQASLKYQHHILIYFILHNAHLIDIRQSLNF